MYKHDTPLLEWHDLPAALGLLTRFPVIVDGKRAAARGAAAAWAYPLVGVILGVVLASTVPFMLLLGLAPSVIAGLLLALQVILTGAMHEDGLADAADGLWGGWTKERRLDIMKDSRIGVYGVCALVLTLFLRWMALFTIVSVGAYWVALIAVGALSRAAMVVLMGVMPNARGGGLSRTVGRPREGTVWIAVLFAAFFAVLCGYPWLIVLAALTAIACGLIARAKIGGQTGDILGATQQITELVLLIAVMTMVT